MKKMNRREAIRLLGRGTMLGSLGLLTGLLGSRVVAGSGEAPCSGAGRCGACPVLPGCELPRGLSARRVLRNEAIP